MDLLDGAKRGRTVVVAGPSLPAEVHALVRAMNAALGSRSDRWSSTSR
jgi:hypothetical protein